MPKPKKKPSVQPELRREWLRQTDEEGKSVPQIATKSHYDVRTVRKAIQWARDDREKREARRIVYRQALEAHYADFVRFANNLDEEITRNKKNVPCCYYLKEKPYLKWLKKNTDNFSLIILGLASYEGI